MSIKEIRNAGNGISFKVRIVKEGDAFGRDMCLTHDKPGTMVEFYDARYLHSMSPEGVPLGQFVSRYNLSTLMGEDRLGKNIFGQDRGLNLDSGIDAWSLDSSAMADVEHFLFTEGLIDKMTSKMNLDRFPGAPFSDSEKEQSAKELLVWFEQGAQEFHDETATRFKSVATRMLDQAASQHAGLQVKMIANNGGVIFRAIQQGEEFQTWNMMYEDMEEKWPGLCDALEEIEGLYNDLEAKIILDECEAISATPTEPDAGMEP